MCKQNVVRLFELFSASVLSLIFSLPVMAQSITSPIYAEITPSSFTTIPVGISGFSGNIRAVVTASSGEVKITTMSGLSAPTGYLVGDWAGGGLELGFEGPVDKVGAALASLAFKGGIANLSVSVVPAGEAYNPDTKSFYEYITTTVTWDAAKIAAEGRTLNGLNGYLATITSEAEKDFVINKVGAGTQVWLGGNDKVTEGTWKWVDSIGTPISERGQIFFTHNGISDDNVDLWCSGEPNNAGGGENALQINTNGCWNDLPHNSSSLGYVVEYTSASDVIVGAEATIILATDVMGPEFARHEAELTEIIQADALRSLRGSSASQQLLSRGARDRIMEASRQNSICDEDQRDTSVERRIDCDDNADNVAFNIDGTAQFARGVLSTRGTFYELLGNIEADKQRLFYGDFNLQRDADGDTTASFNAKMAWEQQLNDASLWGYFVGGSFGHSDIGGTFEGSNDKLSIEAGLYGAHNFGQNLYIDGYAAVGLGANDLEMDNGVLVLDSNFTTRSFTTGMALSGVYAEDAFEVRPELSVNYGKTWIGDVGFTGQAYGLTDGTLSLDAGSVELGTITLRPELIIPLDQQTSSQSNTTLSVSPRFVCEGTRQNSVSVDHCGSGAELGLGYSSDDGLGQADIKLVMDNIAGGTRSSWTVSIEQKF